jgi:hypothetical protein
MGVRHIPPHGAFGIFPGGSGKNAKTHAERQPFERRRRVEQRADFNRRPSEPAEEGQPFYRANFSGAPA